MARKLYFIKLGGSVITNTSRANSAREGEILRLLREVKAGMGKDVSVILGHGSGSFGHISSSKYKLSAGILNKNSRRGTSITQYVDASLHRIVVDKMIKLGMLPISFAPSNCALAAKKKIVSWNIEPMEKALDLGFIPVTYGDILLDSSQGVTDLSTEEIFKFLAKKLKPDKIIIGTNLDGLYTSDPHLNKDAELVRSVSKKNIKWAMSIAGGSRKIDTTGGMGGKLKSLYGIAKSNSVECYIVNAGKRGVLQKMLSGKNGDWTKITY